MSSVIERTSLIEKLRSKLHFVRGWGSDALLFSREIKGVVDVTLALKKPKIVYFSMTVSGTGTTYSSTVVPEGHRYTARAWGISKSGTYTDDNIVLQDSFGNTLNINKTNDLGHAELIMDEGQQVGVYVSAYTSSGTYIIKMYVEDEELEGT